MGNKVQYTSVGVVILAATMGLIAGWIASGVNYVNVERARHVTGDAILSAADLLFSSMPSAEVDVTIAPEHSISFLSSLRGAKTELNPSGYKYLSHPGHGHSILSEEFLKKERVYFLSDRNRDGTIAVPEEHAIAARAIVVRPGGTVMLQGTHTHVTITSSHKNSRGE